MNKKLYLLLFSCLLSASIFTSCSSNELLEGETAEQPDKAVVFGAQSGFLEDTITRAAQQPETKRIILSDGLLVDATLVDEGNMSGTRATTTYEPITTGTGMAFVCSGTTIVRKQNIAVSDKKITVMIPPTGTYTIYMYLNEDGNLSLDNATIPDDNVNNVTIGSRPLDSKDDYATVYSIRASSSTLGYPVTFTPLGTEVRVNMQAGVTPITGFETTLSGIQADHVTDVHVATGAFTVSSTPGTSLSLTNDNSSNSENIYSTSLTSNGSRFFSLSQTATQTAVVTINSISGPDGGTAATVKKTYSSDNTMKFSHAYVNGHRYNLILKLATPITGSVDWHNGTSTGVWPALNGVPLFYFWDAKAPVPFNAPMPTLGSDAYYNTTGVSMAQAEFSCKYCPSFKQMTWYYMAGKYWDKSRWYCPSGFAMNDTKVYTGGAWLKKHSKIDGFSNETIAPEFDQTTYNSTRTGLKPTLGKPGIDKLNSTDANQQNPNDWFFVPAAGVPDTRDRYNTTKMVAVSGYVWLQGSTNGPIGNSSAYDLRIENSVYSGLNSTLPNNNNKDVGEQLWIVQ